jgi:hypothetical protein
VAQSVEALAWEGTDAIVLCAPTNDLLSCVAGQHDDNKDDDYHDDEGDASRKGRGHWITPEVGISSNASGVTTSISTDRLSASSKASFISARFAASGGIGVEIGAGRLIFTNE